MEKPFWVWKAARTWTCDGVLIWSYNDDQISITLRPAVLGSSMPTILQIRWAKLAPLFVMHWYHDGRKRDEEVLVYKPGDWEDAFAPRRGCQSPAIERAFNAPASSLSAPSRRAGGSSTLR